MTKMLVLRAFVIVAIATAVAVYRGETNYLETKIMRPLTSILEPFVGGLVAPNDKRDTIDSKRDGDITKTEASETSQEPRKSRNIEVRFVNQWHAPTSLFWERSEDDWIQVAPSIVDEIGLGTFVGHRFMFTREGTRDQIGDEVEIVASQLVYTLPKNAKPRSEIDGPCTDRYPRRCASLAAHGECDENPGWMIVNCPSSCEACELLDPAKRCDPARLNISLEHIWSPGDLDKTFERIMRDFVHLKPRALSKPPDGPWLIVFDDFISDAESEALTRWGHTLGFERSTDSGVKNERGEQTKKVSQGRTSSNAWCRRDCEEDPLVDSVYARIEEVTQIPRDHYESFQLLKYDVGQYYHTHHDMSPRTRNDAAGPRILTFFLYVSDVQEGGETDFPRIDLRVAPRKGSAVLWPSVLDRDPWLQDPLTHHAALPVKKGVKYGANAWIHARNFVIPNKYACTGSVA
ncbi:Prolyl 4-hydroxylase subunit alpha-1 [Hondaea fermentalgiana]|uniref:Prolyl 4-hydroxylase subunit alpha-1 n=1 Tax=Hondaea fermentalgiana TaxID=2315210 RepID=A0A2R5GTR9_9STRA|nr:Prolyl 4-hydroxylase subunit alpha-1 [Hondaea fermentalgiana]|eukprot:GBG33148.1 Prolyl 4-hydroxylase subunit alpha-1 [Hondaea fermentalgiana]